MIRRHKTKEEKEAEKAFRESERRTKSWLTEQTERANKLHKKEREFFGLEREFIKHQRQMLLDFENSGDMHNPRDVGTRRERILRSFLSATGLLPSRYAVSELSLRVASTTGHISNEIDIGIYDAFDSITLKKEGDVYQVLPVESVYGVIQVKSRLTKAELKSGLENIASFKTLRRKQLSLRPGLHVGSERINHDGFGILFAYDSDMSWQDLAREIEAFAKEAKTSELTNLVFVLNKGFFMLGQSDSNTTAITNSELNQIKDLVLHGRPDRENLCLYNFYYSLMLLLSCTSVSKPSISDYFRLPQQAADSCYQFLLGPFAELRTCSRHGDFHRKISPERLRDVVTWCKGAGQIDILAAQNEVSFPARKQSSDRQHLVYLYNPEGQPLKHLLGTYKEVDGKEVSAGIGYDIILSEGMEIYIPYVYSNKENIIQSCPKCNAKTKSKQR